MSDHTWRLTGETGSLRYMAPEVAQSKPYGEDVDIVWSRDIQVFNLIQCSPSHVSSGYTADIYSFAIMLWEMLTCEKPFDGISHKNVHMETVVSKGGRPKTDEAWGPSLIGFLTSCWHQDLTRRPSASHASSVLKREAAKLAGDGDGLVLNNFRRKSTFVNRNALRETKSQGGRRFKLSSSIASIDEAPGEAEEA